MQRISAAVADVGVVAVVGLDQEDKGQFDKEQRIGFATGCCLLIPKSVTDEAGFLDERFFLYYEDTEYSFRLQKQGIAIWYCPQAVMYHKVGASTRGADSALCAYYIARNWLLCSRLQLGRRYPVFLLYYVINRAVCCLLWLLRGKGALGQGYLAWRQGFSQGTLWQIGILRMRRRRKGFFESQ